MTAAAARTLELSWDPPIQPNGFITQYDVFVNNELRFSGLANSTTVEGLDPFTQYSLLLQACTSVGCRNSSEGSGETLPDSPMGLAAPNLTVLSPSSIEAMWTPPTMPNGEIQRFELHRLFGAELSEREIVYSGLDLETTVTNLMPSTVYYFQLLVFNAGGSAKSPVVDTETRDDIPDGISPPEIMVLNATSLRITWTEPEEPNGDIIQYMLSQDGNIVFNTLGFSFLATGLNPFTEYSYSIMACTVEGCGSSNRSTARTLEAVPEGYVQPTVTSTTANSFTVLINPVTSPNGIVTYMLYVAGEFATGDGSGSIVDERLVYVSGSPSTAEAASLLPFTAYNVTLVVGNSAGNLTGDVFTVRTDPTGEFCNLVVDDQ